MRKHETRSVLKLSCSVWLVCCFSVEDWDIWSKSVLQFLIHIGPVQTETDITSIEHSRSLAATQVMSLEFCALPNKAFKSICSEKDLQFIFSMLTKVDLNSANLAQLHDLHRRMDQCMVSAEGKDPFTKITHEFSPLWILYKYTIPNRDNMSCNPFAQQQLTINSLFGPFSRK